MSRRRTHSFLLPLSLPSPVLCMRMRARGIVQRCFSASSGKKDVFDRTLKARQRGWAIMRPGSDYYDYLRMECADRLVDRLEDIKRDFPCALDLGSHRGHVLDALVRKSTDVEEFGILGGISKLTQSDMSSTVLECARENATKQTLVKVDCLHMDEEDIQCAPESYDLILSSMALHWVNNLPQALQRIKRSLRPDGAFVGCMLGGTTLHELRHSFYLAEQERDGGVAPHVSPLALPSDIAGLMQGAGFNLPTIDVETVTIGYPDALTLMEHLQRMGEGNATYTRRGGMRADTFLATAAAYQEMYGLEDGTIPATFQVIYMIGWAPHHSQPQPLRRGSQKRSMKELEKGGVSG